MLPRLRSNLDFLPSPVPDRPGLVIRDPFQYSDATLIVPPPLIACLEFFDGAHSSLDLREYLVRATGELEVGEIEQHLVDTLSSAGFLEDEAFEERKAAAGRAFAEASVREPSHAGSGYPEEKSELIRTFDEHLNGDRTPPATEKLLAIAAPHVSPFGGVEAYRAAYSSLSERDADRTFVILGTSHYGQPDRLGLTRKPFATPYGETIPDLALINEIQAKSGDAAAMEDYCHAIEHSIEFQVVFLQHLFGPQIRIVPILCGSYANSIYRGGAPEANDHVNRMLGTLGEIAAREGDRLLWVLGIDMAHMGRRYGDPFPAAAERDEMEEVALRDRARIDRMEAGDARGFWDLVQQNQDDLKWCGSAPIYTFLKAVPQARGRLLRYQQWNIDDQSVVSFAGMRFHSS
ncbi:MAG TPA: AmmeMemoRadiSam system protein B [Bryobacteraceae bacterium]|jgi:AmmeMemoRadiSam system protein B|nr:AmmeMemoRadiSam system protein B [Bryobacteraceae bacterium]